MKSIFLFFAVLTGFTAQALGQEDTKLRFYKDKPFQIVDNYKTMHRASRTCILASYDGDNCQKFAGEPIAVTLPDGKTILCKDHVEGWTGHGPYVGCNLGKPIVYGSTGDERRCGSHLIVGGDGNIQGCETPSRRKY